MRAAVCAAGDRARKLCQKSPVVDDFIERFHATGGDVGFRLFPKRIKPPGGDVLVHFLVPLRVEIIAQPARDASGILDRQGADGGFDFGDCAHVN